MKKILVVITSIILLIGCSKPIDETSLVDKEGIMYKSDAKSPYTGEVVGYYQSGEKLYDGKYKEGVLVGDYTYYNKDGSEKEPINNNYLIDRDGVKYQQDAQEPFTGKVFDLWDNGNKKLEGSYKDGLMNREWIWYYDDGKKFVEGYYIYGTGENYIIDENVLIPLDGADGRWTYWYPDGQKRSEGIFINGEEDGLWTYWSENGQKEEEGTLRDGKKDGIWTWWYENGQEQLEGTFKDGKGEGIWTYWYENGQKKQEGTLKDGKKDGIWTWWYENGQKKQEGAFKDGKFVGKWTYYNEDGNIRDVVNY